MHTQQVLPFIFMQTEYCKIANPIVSTCPSMQGTNIDIVCMKQAQGKLQLPSQGISIDFFPVQEIIHDIFYLI